MNSSSVTKRIVRSANSSAPEPDTFKYRIRILDLRQVTEWANITVLSAVIKEPRMTTTNLWECHCFHSSHWIIPMKWIITAFPYLFRNPLGVGQSLIILHNVCFFLFLSYYWVKIEPKNVVLVPTDFFPTLINIIIIIIIIIFLSPQTQVKA
jgi:hypothetical protein